MKNKKPFLFILLVSTLLFSGTFKQRKVDRTRQPDRQMQNQYIRALNEGLPYHQGKQRFDPDHILVKFKPTLTGSAVASTLSSYRLKKIKRIPKLNIYKLQIPKSLTVQEMVYALNQNPDVEYAEPNYIAYIVTTPNDALFSYQYALFNSGQSIGSPGSPQGTERADIKATAAWEETKGDNQVIIAVIDTGVDLLHPDLKNKVLSGGRDFANEDFDATDDNGHGTHVAGIAAAETNNTEGIAGVAWNCKILPIKAMDFEGSGYYDWIIDAIRWASDNGANVINLSLGGEADAQSLKDAVRYAFQKGIVIAAAAGNESTAVIFPAAYDDYCLAVAATDYKDIRTDWSNFGPEVDVAAPGERVISCVPTWFWGPDSLPYAFGFGTSMATPHVAGLAALIKSLKPWLKASEIMDIIRYTADDTNKTDYSGVDEFIGYGRINMEKALVPIKITSSKSPE